MNKNVLARIAITIALLVFARTSFAEEILTVHAGGKLETFTYEELVAMPQTQVITKNDYIDDPATFSGPRLREILVRYGIESNAELRLRALNDFSVVVPASDAFDFDVILALLRDGERMSIRDKGPIWVIYPMDDHPELRDDSYNSRLIWQLESISVE